MMRVAYLHCFRFLRSFLFCSGASFEGAFPRLLSEPESIRVSCQRRLSLDVHRGIASSGNLNPCGTTHSGQSCAVLTSLTCSSISAFSAGNK